MMTIHFHHSSNHQVQEAFKQMLQKRNRLEELKFGGHQRDVRKHKCSSYGKYDHNKRTCPDRKALKEELLAIPLSTALA